MDLVNFRCPHCTAYLTAERNKAFLYCEYCGSKLMLDEIEIYKEEAITERHRITEEEKRITRMQQFELIAHQLSEVGGFVGCVIVIGLMMLMMYLVYSFQ